MNPQPQVKDPFAHLPPSRWLHYRCPRCKAIETVVISRDPEAPKQFPAESTIDLRCTTCTREDSEREHNLGCLVPRVIHSKARKHRSGAERITAD